jgi:hypothetical protein
MFMNSHHESRPGYPLFYYPHYILKSKFERCTCNVTLRCVRINIVAVEKQYVLRIKSVRVCILSLVIQHANHMLCNTSSSDVCLALPGFS